MVQQHHDAVAVGVAIEMTGDDRTVLPADGDQPLVEVFFKSSGVPQKGLVPHWYVSYDVDLEGQTHSLKKTRRG